TLVVVGIYVFWQSQTIEHVNAVVEAAQLNLKQITAGYSVNDLLSMAQSDLVKWFIPNRDYFFYEWVPLVLLVSPLLIFHFRKQYLLALMVGLSIVAYLLMMRFAGLAILYIKFTYNEILYTPVRNVIFFVYILTGVFFFVLAERIAKMRSAILLVL